MESMLDQLSVWQNNASGAEFIYIFGKNMGEHLWNKFHDLHHNTLDLWNFLDTDNRKLLACHIQAIMVPNSDPYGELTN